MPDAGVSCSPYCEQEGIKFYLKMVVVLIKQIGFDKPEGITYFCYEYILIKEA